MGGTGKSATVTVLLDSDVVIDHLRGEAAARELLRRLAHGQISMGISVITVAEIEAGVRESESQAVEALFAGLLIFPVDKAIARQAGRYRALYGKSHGVLLPGALIAARQSSGDSYFTPSTASIIQWQI